MTGSMGPCQEVEGGWLHPTVLESFLGADLADVDRDRLITKMIDVFADVPCLDDDLVEFALIEDEWGIEADPEEGAGWSVKCLSGRLHRRCQLGQRTGKRSSGAGVGNRAQFSVLVPSPPGPMDTLSDRQVFILSTKLWAASSAG